MKHFKKILAILLLLVLTITPVYAEKINENDSNFLADDNLVVEKNLGGNLFAAGTSVKVKGNVDGAAFLAGSRVTVTSEQDYLFIGAQDIELDEATAKDAFIAGQMINISNSNLRDLFVAGQVVKIESTTARNVRAAGEKVVVSGTIFGDLIIGADKLEIEEDTVIEGKLVINEDAIYEKPESVTISEIETYKDESANVHKKVNPLKIILYTIIDLIISYVTLLLIALLIVAVYKKFYANIKKFQKEENFPLKALGIGFLTLIAVPVAAIIIMITVVGIPLSLIALGLYALFIYLSAIPSSYYVGSIIFKDKIKNEYLLVAVSLLIFYAVKWIPLAGGLISFASLIFGLGTLVYMLKGIIKK